MGSPVYPFVSSPILIDPTSTNTKGFVGATAQSSGFAANYPPIVHGTNLYQLLIGEGTFYAGGPYPIQMYKSTDGGNTWTVQNLAGQPSVANAFTAGVFFDGANTVIVAYQPTGGPIIGVTGNIQFQNFNLSTDTWGAVYGNVAGSPASFDTLQCFKRPDGSILVLYARTYSGGQIKNVSAGVYASGSWSTFAVDSNVTGGYTPNGYCAAAMDPATGNILVTGTARNSVPQSEVWVQLVLSNNTLGTFTVLAGDPYIVDETRPVAVGSSWIFAAYNTSTRTSQIAVGSPLTAPSFTLYSQGTFDPSGPSWVYSRNFSFDTDGTNLFMAYLGYDGTQAVIRIGYTTNLSSPSSGWTNINAFASTNGLFFTSGTIWIQFLAITRLSGNTTASAQALSIVGGTTTSQYFFSGFAPSGPVPNCSSLGSGSLGVPYSGTITATGGTPPYTFKIISGSLPPGLTLNTATGVISGTPTAAGTFNFTVQVTDSASLTGTANCSIVINPPAGCSSGTVGQPFSCTMTGIGGCTTGIFQVVSGSLPPGVTLNPTTGVISGTPTVPGTYNYTIEETCETPTPCVTLLASFTVTIAALVTLSIAAPAQSIVGTAYSQTLSATGGTPPYTFAVTSGSLPPGLSMTSAGVVTGTPTAIGTSCVTITVTDSATPTPNSTPVVLCFIVAGSPAAAGTVILYEWAPSFIPKREVTRARPSDYTDCGYTGRKFIRGFRMHADTFGATRAVTIQYDGGQNGPAFQATHNGEETIAYSITPADEPQPLIATYVRLNPTDGLDWLLWEKDTTWEFDPYPDLTSLRTPWQQPNGGNQMWVQGIRLTADTGGLNQDLQILGDGNQVMTTINVNHSGQQTLPYTWQPFLAHDLAIQPKGPCAIWNASQLAWVWTPVPETVTFWIARPTSFGMEGFFHFRDGVFAYGAGPGILNITMDTGETQAINIPAATQTEQKFYWVANPLKGMLATISVIGCPLIQIYVEDIEMRVKQWGSTGPYRVVRIPGDISRVEARI